MPVCIDQTMVKDAVPESKVAKGDHKIDWEPVDL